MIGIRATCDVTAIGKSICIYEIEEGVGRGEGGSDCPHL